MAYNLKKIYSTCIILFALFLVLESCITYIGPGYTGVCIDMLAKNDVQDTVLQTGIHFLPPWYRVWSFPCFEQNVSWEGRESFKFQTSEGLATDADIGLTFNVDVEMVPQLFKRYRSGINEISQKFLKNYLRDAITMAASSRGIEELYGKGKEKFLFDVENVMKDKLKPLGLIVQRVYLVDAFEFPESVVRALNLKIEAAQRAEQRENELREATAQAKKEIAKAKGDAKSRLLNAKSEADSNLMIQRSLSENMLIYEVIKQWDGHLPQTIAGGTAAILR